MEHKEIQTKIRERAEERDVPLSRLAQEIGVSTQAIYEVTAGRSRSAWLRFWICKRLGFEPAELGWPEFKIVNKEE